MAVNYTDCCRQLAPKTMGRKSERVALPHVEKIMLSMGESSGPGR